MHTIRQIVAYKNAQKHASKKGMDDIIRLEVERLVPSGDLTQRARAELSVRSKLNFTNAPPTYTLTVDSLATVGVDAPKLIEALGLDSGADIPAIVSAMYALLDVIAPSEPLAAPAPSSSTPVAMSGLASLTPAQVRLARTMMLSEQDRRIARRMGKTDAEMVKLVAARKRAV